MLGDKILDGITYGMIANIVIAIKQKYNLQILNLAIQLTNKKYTIGGLNATYSYGYLYYFWK
jgi:hypothetical protein